MDITTRRDAFVNFTSAGFYQNISSGCTSHMQQEETEGEDESLHQQRNHTPVDTQADSADVETVKRVWHVLGEEVMDILGFLNMVCWGNRLAVADPTTRFARVRPTPR